MSDNHDTPIPPTEEGCASWSATMDNSAKAIEKIKRNNNLHRQSAEPDSSNLIELPQPMFREVPVHVTRTQNRSVQVIPPPSTQPQAPPSRRKDEGRRRSKRAGGNEGDDGSESDSGGEGRRNGPPSPDGPLQKRKPLQPQAEPSSQHTPRLKKWLTAQKPLVLSPEEEERVRNIKKLNAFENSLEARLELREVNKVEGERRRKALWTEDRRLMPEALNWDQLEEEKAALDEYLDESLYSAIVDDRLGSQTDKPDRETVIAGLIAEVEAKVTETLKRSIASHRVLAHESLPGTLISVPRGRHVSHPPHFIRFPYEMEMETDSPSDVKFDLVLFHGNRNSRNPLVSKYLSIITDGLVDDFIGGLPAVDLLMYSGRFPEKPNQLTPEYIEWLRSSVGAATFDRWVAHSYQRIARKQPLAEYRESMRAINMNVSQEFFQTGPDVDLVLFKGGRPSVIQRVSPMNLRSIGWRQNRISGKVYPQGEETFWRYVTFDDYPGKAFKVDIDGDVLAIKDYFRPLSETQLERTRIQDRG